METQEKKTFREGLVAMIVKARTVLLVLGIVIVVGLIGMVVYQQVINAGKAQNGIVLDALDKAYTTWESEKDDTKKKELATALQTRIDEALKGSASAQQYGLFVQGNFLYAEKNFKDAATAYAKAADMNSASYLYPVATFMAAGAFEESGDIENSKTRLKTIADSEALANPLTVRAIFSLARILEGEGKKDEAKTYYQKIVDTYPDSGWTKLARDRIIYLEIQA